MVDAFESIENSLYVGLQEKSVNVSKRDSNIRIQLPGLQKRIVCDDVTVVNDDQFWTELAAGLQKPPVRRISTKSRNRNGALKAAISRSLKSST